MSHGNRVRPCYTGGGPVVDVFHVVPVEGLENGTYIPDGQVDVGVFDDGVDARPALLLDDTRVESRHSTKSLDDVPIQI